jgi:hypothetical protein
MKLTDGKAGLVRLSIDSVRPAPENELIYRPVSQKDPDVRELTRSIAKHGVKEPLVVSRDGFILSGHRRHAAARAAGIHQVPCRIEDIYHDDPRFVEFLREYNRQRVKSFDEVVREQVVSVDPGEAYKSLIEHRMATSRVSADFLVLDGPRKRKAISTGKRQFLIAARGIVRARRNYWPLFDRSIHYDLLNDPPLRHTKKPDSRYENTRTCYKDVCDLLTRARLAGLIPFAAIEDPTRTVCSWDLHRSVSGFIGDQLDGFLNGYWRDLQQSQPNHIEIVGEKNTIEGSVRPVSARFCIPYTLGRGYCSLDPRRQMHERYKAIGKERLIILIMSDFDPDGEEIAASFARSMRDDFGVTRVDAKKVCLTYEQVLERDLPQTFDIKKTSPRYKKFAARYGDRAHELEALPPEERSRLLTAAIDEVIETEAFNRELDAERQDATRLEALRIGLGPILMDALGSKSDKSDYDHDDVN